MIYVNGEKKEGYEGLPLDVLLQGENFQKERIAVEINGEIVSKKIYGETVLADGDTVEVVSFVGGG